MYAMPECSDTDEDDARTDTEDPKAAAAASAGAALNSVVQANALKKKQGGGSTTGSNLDEAENANDDADYRRGQRCKKLNRVLNSEAVSII